MEESEDDELEALRKENETIKQQNKQNEDLILTLSQQLKQITQKAKTQQRIHQLKDELEQLEKEKEKLLVMVECQECIISKQKESLNNPVLTMDQKFIQYSPSERSNQHRSPQEKHFIELQDEINRILGAIDNERINIHNKRNHIQNMREQISSIAVLKKEIEQRESEIDVIDEKKANLQMLKMRIQDHQSFLSDSPEKIQTKYEVSKDMYMNKQRYNLERIHHFQDILSDLQSKV